ncbi:MAG: MOSC domain-containing protein [Rhodospirillales bacterium]|nr:MOSC domain-containing protein [Rhodospirillales bacterium]
MRVLSVNVSLPKDVVHDGEVVSTGIFKEPVTGRCRVRKLGIEGDGQADLTAHGGPDQAVYAYPVEHYGYWKKELGRDHLPYGQFGENLTIEGIDEATALVGDVLQIGSAVLQVTQPRLPCYKLGIRMGAGATFPRRFQRSGRVGFYLRVLKEGQLVAGDRIKLIERGEGRVSIAEFLQVYASKRPSRQAIARVLAAPGLSEAWRSYLEGVLEDA